MKIIHLVLLSLCFIGTSCSYTAVTRLGKGKVAVVKNDFFLLGALRKIYVCKATKSGLSNCSTNQNP